MARSSAGAGWLHNSAGLLAGSNGPFTIAFWFKAADLGQSNKYALISFRNSDSAQWAVIWEFTNNQLEFFNFQGAGSDPRTDSGVTIPDTNWHHVAYRKAASGASAWDKFLNGTKTAINASIDFTLPTGLDRTVLLAATVAGANNVAAAIADVWIGAAALTDEQIAMLAAGKSGRFIPETPAAHYELVQGNHELRGGTALTVGGTVTTVADPTLAYPVAPVSVLGGGLVR